MKRISWQIILGLSLIVLSLFFYLIHYTIFRDPHHIFIYMIGDIAFVFIEVLLVTLIIHQLLSMREKRARLEKLNMVIGAFFSEVGTRLVTYFSDLDPKLDRIRKELIVTDDWSEQEFSRVSKRLKSYDYGVEIQEVELEYLRDFLMEKKGLSAPVTGKPEFAGTRVLYRASSGRLSPDRGIGRQGKYKTAARPRP